MSANAAKTGAIAYGVFKRSEVRDLLELKAEELRVRGFAVLQSGMSPQDLNDLRASIDRVYAEQAAETPGIDAGADANVARAPLAYDELFLKAALDPSVLALANAALGENFVLLQQNAIINRPSSAHSQARWHRDLIYQHFTSSVPLAISALFCVDDFSPETGGTFFLPGSHLVEEFPSDEFIRCHEEQIEAPAGSLVVFDSMTFHRAGQNASNRVRRALNHVIGRPFMAQQIDLPRLLQGRHERDPFLARYLGYRWNPAPDVRSWRRARR